VIVYQAEAHAKDRWDLEENHDDGVCFTTPKTLQDRIGLAKHLQSKYNLKSHILVDDMTNEAMPLFCAWPERLFVLDSASKEFRFIGGPGPFWYTLDPMAKILEDIIKANSKQ